MVRATIKKANSAQRLHKKKKLFTERENYSFKNKGNLINTKTRLCPWVSMDYFWNGNTNNTVSSEEYFFS